jgi:putative FmdB family regulatory protein
MFRRSKALPLYEYECPKCGRFERVQKFSDPLLSTCPTCGQPVEKLLSPPAIQFKGSGWYVTDYAGKSSGKEKDDKKTESKDTKASDKGSGESKKTETSKSKSSDKK